jgi:hypothetical protein
MNIILGCEESQSVCIEMRKKGHNAYSCDIQECSGGHPEWHIQADIFEVIKGGYFVTQFGNIVFIDKWDLGIFFPPCTYLSYVGNRWLDIEKYGQKAIERSEKRELAKEFFLSLLNCNIPKVAIENPRGYVMEFLKPTQIIQPYYFGDSFSKATCLWLKGLPKLYHNKIANLFDNSVTHVFKGEMTKNGGLWMNTAEVLSMPQSERSKVRSKTFPGIARAMADQWG